MLVLEPTSWSKVAGPWGGHWGWVSHELQWHLYKRRSGKLSRPYGQGPGKGELGSGSFPDTDTLVWDFQLPEL